MNTSEKRTFVIANKSLLATTVTNKAINALEDDKLDVLVTEIQSHPEFEDAEPSAEIIVAGAPQAQATEDMGLVMYLPFVKLSTTFKSVVLAYGDKELYCNNSTLVDLALNDKVPAGTLICINAESIETDRNGKFNAKAIEKGTQVMQELRETKNNAELKKQMLINKYVKNGMSRNQAVAKVQEMINETIEASADLSFIM